MSGRCSLTRILRLAWARLSRAEAHLYFDRGTLTPRSADAAKRALENAQKLEPELP